MHWKSIDTNCSVPQKSIAPRISMIVAVSSHGDVWVCLSHSNSNKSMMGVFVEKLCLKLDQQNPHWRNSHILTWDGKCRPPGWSIVLFAHKISIYYRSSLSQSGGDQEDAGAAAGAHHDERPLQL